MSGAGLTPGVVPYDPISYLRANARRPQGLAIYDGDKRIDFPELLDIVASLVADLGARGLGPGDVVAVALPNVWRYVALELAVPAAGCVLLPLPMALGRREMRSALERSGAAAVVIDDSATGERLAATAAELASGPAVIDAAALDVDGDVDGANLVDGEPDPDRIVQIALTSGTTGLPKLASLSARLKQLTFEGFTRRLRIGPDDGVVPLSPVTQGAGEMCLYALRTGATLVMSPDVRFDAARSLALVERGGATVIGAVPTMLTRLLQEPALGNADLGAVRATLCAGAPLSPAVARAWEERTDSRVCNFYGAMDVGQLSVPDPQDPAEKRWTTVGRPHDAAEWQISTTASEALGRGQEGEICMRGPLVQDRYWGEDFGPYSPDGWAHFGDLGFVDDEGYLHVTGRLKDTIIRGGTNINPYEVEEVLRGCAAIAEVCVVGKADEDLGERSAAFVVAGEEPRPSLDDLREYLEGEGLARYKWPELLLLVDAIPTGSTGKVDRTALRARLAEEDH